MKKIIGILFILGITQCAFAEYPNPPFCTDKGFPTEADIQALGDVTAMDRSAYNKCRAKCGQAYHSKCGTNNPKCKQCDQYCNNTLCQHVHGQ